MAQNSEIDTPYSQSQQINARDNALLQIVLALSLQETHTRHHKRDNGLSSRFSKLIQNMKMTKSSQKCSICLEGFQADQIIKRLPCKHIFHRECAKTWLKINKHCPNCRFDVQWHFEHLQKQGRLTTVNAPVPAKGIKPKQQQNKNSVNQDQMLVLAS